MSTRRNRANLEQILRQVVEINDKVMAIESKGKKLTQKERVAIIDEPKKIIDAIRDLFKLEVKTYIGDKEVSYETIVEVDGDVESRFPKELNGAIFTRHNQLVDFSWEIRKTILLKIIDVIIELLKNL
jgi:hypothetical protein